MDLTWSLVWEGLQHKSLEHCIISTVNNGFEMSSNIVGLFDDRPAYFNYFVRTDNKWRSVHFEVDGQMNDLKLSFSMTSDGNGHWLKEGKEAPQFDGCMDIDLPITPLTHGLSINRIALAPGQTLDLPTIYINVLSGELKRICRRYSRINEYSYRSESLEHPVITDIEMDANGLLYQHAPFFKRLYAMNI